MIFSSSLKRIMVLAAILATGFGLVTCNSNPSGAEDFTYRIEGVMVVDINRDTVIVAVDVYRDDAKFAGATASVDGRPLSFNATGYTTDSVYTLFEDSVSNYFDRALQLEISDGTNFTGTFNLFVPDSFYIPSDGIRIPANRLLQSAGNVTLEWTPSGGTGGYILNAVHEDSIYSNWGYSEIGNPNNGNGGTIPADAFVLTDGINPDTGLYNIYIYSIGFSPDSALSAAVLPVPLPDVLDDNVVQPDFTARLGTIVVCEFDTVRVVTQTN